MPSDDMYVLMYRIIAYLYDCMKKGEEPIPSEWDCNVLGIPEPYWCQVVAELVEHGYIKGVEVYRSGRALRVVYVQPTVSMEGVAFAQENSMMGKARKFLMDVKASVPFI